MIGLFRPVLASAVMISAGSYRRATLVCAFCLAASQLTLAAETEDVHPYLETDSRSMLGSFIPIGKWICG